MVKKKSKLMKGKMDAIEGLPDMCGEIWRCSADIEDQEVESDQVTYNFS